MAKDNFKKKLEEIKQKAELVAVEAIASSDLAAIAELTKTIAEAENAYENRKSGWGRNAWLLLIGALLSAGSALLATGCNAYLEKKRNERDEKLKFNKEFIKAMGTQMAIQWEMHRERKFTIKIPSLDSNNKEIRQFIALQSYYESSIDYYYHDQVQKIKENILRKVISNQELLFKTGSYDTATISDFEKRYRELSNNLTRTAEEINVLARD